MFLVACTGPLWASYRQRRWRRWRWGIIIAPVARTSCHADGHKYVHSCRRCCCCCDFEWRGSAGSDQGAPFRAPLRQSKRAGRDRKGQAHLALRLPAGVVGRKRDHYCGAGMVERSWRVRKQCWSAVRGMDTFVLHSHRGILATPWLQQASWCAFVRALVQLCYLWFAPPLLVYDID